MPSEDFLQHGRIMMGCHKNVTAANEVTRFRSMFGTSPEICSLLWDHVDPLSTMPNGVQDVHLLWGLMFLKLYAAESVHCALAGGWMRRLFENGVGRLFMQLLT